jgi:formylmethanofuran dehydrogenase subunit E
MGIMQDDIPLEEQMELVHLVWDAPEADILNIGEIITYDAESFPEVLGFKSCDSCGELTACAYLWVVGAKNVCIPCSGYDR